MNCKCLCLHVLPSITDHFIKFLLSFFMRITLNDLGRAEKQTNLSRVSLLNNRIYSSERERWRQTEREIFARFKLKQNENNSCNLDDFIGALNLNNNNNNNRSWVAQTMLNREEKQELIWRILRAWSMFVAFAMAFVYLKMKLLAFIYAFATLCKLN